MAGRRTVPDITRTFEEVYQSLLRDGYQWEEQLGCQRADYAVSARSRNLTVHRSSVTSNRIQENVTMSLSNSTYILCENPLGDERFMPDTQYFCSEVKRKVKCVRSVNLDSNDTSSRQDALSRDTVDSGFQDQLDVLFDKKELSSIQSSNEGGDECNASVDMSANVIKQLLCSSCQKRKNKVVRNPSTGIKIFKVSDPNHWCSDHWMLKRCRHKGYTPELDEKRSINTTLNTIFALKSNNFMEMQRTCYRCSRPHAFLQRNLRLCKQAQEQCIAVLPKKHRRTNSTNRAKPLKRAAATNGKSKQPFMLVLNLSQDEDSDKDVKSVKLKAKNKTQRCNRSPHLSGLQTAGLCASNKKKSLHSETSILVPTSPHVPDSASESGGANDLETETSDPFSWVDGGSFRKLLTHLNSGPLRSAIIKEH